MKSSKAVIFFINVFAIVIFFIIWYFIIGFPRIHLHKIWYIPILVFSLMTGYSLIINLYLGETVVARKTVYELIKRIEDNSVKIITIIALMSALPALFLSSQKLPYPFEFYSLIFIVIVFVLGGTMSFLDMHEESALKFLVILKQIKIICYIQAITWTLCSLLSLNDWIFRIATNQ